MGGNNNIYLGYTAGYSETASNRLYISNNAGGNNDALIYGQFDTKKLQFNNKVGIGIIPESYPLEIKGINFGNDQLIKFYDNAGTPKWHLRLETNGGFGFTETNVADRRLVLNPGGEVAIGKVPGTTNDDSRLQVKQKGSQNGFGIEAASNTNQWAWYVTNGTSSNLFMYYNGSYKGVFSNVDGAYVMASDRRLKKDILPYLPTLSSIMQLKPYQYHYIDNQATDALSTGFMAQDVQKYFPMPYRKWK